MADKVMTEEDWQALRLRGTLLMEKVADRFGVTAEDVRGKGRAEPIQQARYITAFILNLVELMPEDIVGQVINRSEASVINYCDRANTLLEQSEDARKKSLGAWSLYRSERKAA